MMSQAELLAYVRGGEDGTVYSQAQLLAQDYATSPFAAGILSNDYRFAFYDTAIAKPFRTWTRLETATGEAFEEQTEALNGKAIADCRCLVWDTQIRIEQENFGGALETATMLSVLPEEVELHRGDLVLLTQAASARTSFARFDRTAGAVQVLTHWPCSEIVGVWVNKVKLSATAYSATPTGIQWGPGAPDVGQKFSVRWKYLPLFQWSEDEQGTLQLGSDGLPLPQIGRVHLLNKTPEQAAAWGLT